MSVDKTQIAVSSIIEELNNGPLVCGWPEADGECVYLAIGSEVYGWDYGIPYINLNEPLNQDAASAVRKIWGVDHDIPGVGQLLSFAKDYRESAETCNTEFKKEFLQLADRLDQSVAKAIVPKIKVRP